MTPDTAISGPAPGARPGSAAASPQGGYADGHRPGRRAEKGVESRAPTGWASRWAWRCGAATQAGPFQTVPHPGPNWRPEGDPARQPHEYIRNGTAKGAGRAVPPRRRPGAHRGVGDLSQCGVAPLAEARVVGDPGWSCPTRLHGGGVAGGVGAAGEAGLAVKPTLPTELPPLRMLSVLDNLAGHKTPEFVLWLFAHGVMPVYTPVGGSWLNMAESIQRVLKRRALEGRHPATPEEIIAWFKAVARHWNADPTPFEVGRQAGGGAASARASAPPRRIGRADAAAATAKGPTGLWPCP